MTDAFDKNRSPFLPPESELEEHFILTGGPGGQHVNRTESGVQLRFDAMNSARFSPAVRQRLIDLAGNRADARGVITIEAKSHRSQFRNREDARERLADLIEEAHKKPKTRIKTRPSRRAKKKRLEAKRKHSRIKARRKPPKLDE
jgi:ribosome-associated protein